jgi:hypothetical protein
LISLVDERFFVMVRIGRLLEQLENDLAIGARNCSDAGALREHAFHLLDWCPALLTLTHHMVVNTLLQAAFAFQKSALLETKIPRRRMADEMTATKLVAEACQVARLLGPGSELYALQTGLKCVLLHLKYDTGIQELQKRLIWLAEFFPMLRVGN